MATFRFLDTDIEYDAFWNSLLFQDEVKASLRLIEADLRRVNYQPKIDRAFHFLTRPKPKVIILGQDPYSTEGKATGRAFEPAGVTAWRQLNPTKDSLVNIVRALHRTHRVITASVGRRMPVPAQAVPYEAVLADQSFLLSPPEELFDYWESEGVLLLNTALTVKPGRSELHLPLWAPFTNHVVRYLDEQVPDGQWFLWGLHAQGYGLMVRNGTKHERVHPSPKNDDTGPWSFAQNDHFYRTKEIINWFGPLTTAPPNPLPIRSRKIALRRPEPR